MGFIDYHGTKEDRYTEVLEYSRAQQDEDWNRKEEKKITIWLRDLTGNSRFAQLNVEDLIKYVVVKYRSMQNSWIALMKLVQTNPLVDENQLWKDFSLDLVARHLDSFHLDLEKRKKYLQAFQKKIFKITEPLPPEDHYHRVAENPKYRRYFTECFDPTWKGQQVFKWMWAGSKKNPEGQKHIDDFLDANIQVGLFIGLYLHQVIMPHDDGWMREIEAERKAFSDLLKKMHRAVLSAPDISLLINPYSKTYAEGKGDKTDSANTDETPDCKTEKVNEEQSSSQIPDSGLDKNRFYKLLKKGGIQNYVEASKFLLECSMPDEIAQTYQQLIDRMPILQDAVIRFDEIYHVDMDQFEEYYAPETLKITAVYLDYQAAGPSEKILKETKEGVFLATRKLLQVVNEKIDEIYQFVAIDANAEAKALETIMSQDGYVDPENRIKFGRKQ